MVSLELQPGFYDGCEGHGWHKAISVLQGISMDDMQKQVLFLNFVLAVVYGFIFL